MKIRDILQQTPFAEIADILVCHYGDHELASYRMLYDRLLHDCAEAAAAQPYRIRIEAYRAYPGREPALLTSFRADDHTLYFDVSADTGAEDTVYSVTSIDKRVFPDCEIHPRTLEQFSYAAILAHCFWEITCYTFD